MSNAWDSQLSSGLSAALIPPAAATECERTGWTLEMIADRRAGLCGRQRSPLAGQPGADDQHVVGGHEGRFYLRRASARFLGLANGTSSNDDV